MTCLHAGTTLRLTSAPAVTCLQKLLNSVLMYHTNAALTAVPTVLHLVNNILSLLDINRSLHNRAVGVGLKLDQVSPQYILALQIWGQH